MAIKRKLVKKLSTTGIYLLIYSGTPVGIKKQNQEGVKMQLLKNRIAFSKAS